jgi:hypothetical protein
MPIEGLVTSRFKVISCVGGVNKQYGSSNNRQISSCYYTLFKVNFREILELKNKEKRRGGALKNTTRFFSNLLIFVAVLYDHFILVLRLFFNLI